MGVSRPGNVRGRCFFARVGVKDGFTSALSLSKAAVCTNVHTLFALWLQATGHGCEDAAVLPLLQTQQRAPQEHAVPPGGR